MSVLNSVAQGLLDQIARGESVEITPELHLKLSSMMLLGVIEQVYMPSSNEFLVTDLGWSFVTDQRALAVKRLRNAPMTDSRLGYPTGEYVDCPKHEP